MFMVELLELMCVLGKMVIFFIYIIVDLECVDVDIVLLCDGCI